MLHRPKSLTIIVAVLALVSAPMLGFSEVFASDPFIAEIVMFGGNFAPRGWAFCDGQLLPIAQNTALFSILGTTYGGDGRTTFALPDLRGRVAMHAGGSTGPGLSSRPLGQKGGVETVTLTVQQMPNHTHQLMGTAERGDSTSPAGSTLADDPREDQYKSGSPALVGMSAGAVGSTGGSQPHTNVQPFTCVNFIIALVGVFPSRN